MGSIFELNDTLQLTAEQGFPVRELNLEKHLKNPYKASDFTGKVFTFKNKPNIRNYQMPPVRNFLVENRSGKWICWGLCQILEITHDYVNKTTSGKYTITMIYSPDEIKRITPLIWGEEKLQYFK